MSEGLCQIDPDENLVTKAGGIQGYSGLFGNKGSALMGLDLEDFAIDHTGVRIPFPPHQTQVARSGRFILLKLVKLSDEQCYRDYRSNNGMPRLYS